LLPLAAVVAVAHLLLLGATPARLVLAPAATAQPFVTRTVALAPEPPIAPALPPVAHRPEQALQPAQPRRAASPARALAKARSRIAASSAPLLEPVALSNPPASQEPTVAAAARAVPLSIPGSMRLHYRVSASVRGIGLTGQGELVWRHDGHDYEASLEVSAPLLPTRSQRSTGRITPEGLAPLRFSDKSRSEQAAHFQRDKGKVSFSNNQPDAPLLPGAQDRLSVLLQLGAMIAGDPQRFGPDTTIAIQTAGTHDAEQWLFTVEGEEELQLPGGAVHALKLIRNPRKQFDQKVELWLAPAMDYAPVRLRLTQPNGDSVDQQWSSTDRG
jgi:hypothetical protein